jgi:outer membrane protein
MRPATIRAVAALTSGAATIALGAGVSAATIQPARRQPARRHVVAAPLTPVRPALSLADAQRLALANIPDLRAAQFDFAAANEGIKIARAQYQPQASGEFVQAFAGPGTRLSAYNVLSDPTIIQRTALGVGISQYITDFGRTTSLVRAAEADLQAQAARETQTRDLALLDVTQSYFEVLRAGSLLSVAQQTVGARQTLLRQISALQRAGLRSMLDVSIGQRDLAAAKQELLAAQARQRDSYSNLSAALGFNEEHLYRLRDIATLPATPTLTPLIDAALRNSPELAATQAQGAAAALRAVAVAREAYPTLNAYGFFGVTPIRATNQAIDQSYSAAGIALNVPIFNGGGLSAERRQAEDAANSLTQAFAAQRDRLLRDVRVAYDTVSTARGNIGLSEQVLRTAREALRFTQARYQIGLGSITDLSQAQIAEDQAAIARSNATYDYIVQAASLEYVTGLMLGTDLFPGADDAGITASRATPSPIASPSSTHTKKRKFLGLPL